MKKIFGLFLVGLAASALASCDNSNSAGEAYVSLDINPEIELIVENNKVVSVYANNDDAKTMLYNEESLEGKTFDEALEVITELSIEYGYLDEENKVIDYTVTADEDEDLEEKLAVKIEKSVSKKAEKLGFKVSLKAEGLFSIECELDELKELYPDNEAIQALTVHDYKIIQSALSSDSKLTIEAAVELSTKELIDIIQASRDEMYNVMTKKYEKLVVESEEEFKKLENQAIRAIYASYYVKDLQTITAHPVNYGALYAMYGTAKDALQSIVNIYEKFEDVEDKVLTEEDVEEIVEEVADLGLTEEEVIEGVKDSEGNITLEGINDYFDKVVKNIDDKKLKEGFKDVKDELKDLKNKTKDVCKNINDTYKIQIKKLIKTIEATEDTLEATIALLPDTYKEIISAYITEMDTMIDIIETSLDGDCEIEEIKGWITEFEAKEAELLNKIKEDLSEEELAEINELIEKGSTAINEAKDKFHKNLEDVHTKCNEYLDQMKDQAANNINKK